MANGGDQDADYRYDEDAEGHENQLEFDSNYATYEVLKERGLLDPELEQRIREDLEQDRPGAPAQASAGGERADAQLEAKARERLEQLAGIDVSALRLSVQKGEITLEGMVDSRPTKRLAEDVLETLPGMRDIHNRLRIDH